MLSLLNQLTLQKNLQNFVTNNVFLTKLVKSQQQQNKKSNIKTLLEPGIESGNSGIQSGCVTSAPPIQLIETIVVKLFNCFDVIDRNVNKKAEFAGHTFSIKFIYL